MSNLEGSSYPLAEAAGSRARSDRLRVITAGRVGNMEARLGTSGFDVVAIAETEDGLIDAVSADEPDAIVVEADLCASLELVRDLAPDAVVIVVGDHTPPGALGRVEPGMSGTAMAGLLHALVAEGVGAAVVWGLVPTFRAGALQAPQRVGLSLLSANADLVRAHLASALRDPAHLVTVAGTVALTVSASLLVTFSGPRSHDRPERVPGPAPTVERAQQHPVVAPSPSTRIPAQSPHSGDGHGPIRGESTDQGHHADEGGSQDNNGQGGTQDGNDQGENEDNADQGETQDSNDQGGNQDGNDQGENEDNADQGETQDSNDQGEDQENNDQGGNQDGRRPQAAAPSVAFGIARSGLRKSEVPNPGLKTRLGS